MSNDTKLLKYPWHKVNPGTDEGILAIRHSTDVADPFEVTDSLQDLGLPCAWKSLETGITVVALPTVTLASGYDAQVGARFYVIAENESTNVTSDVRACSAVPADLIVEDGSSELRSAMDAIPEERRAFADGIRNALIAWVLPH